MSDASGASDELIVLAGEFVLGTLPRDEALRLEHEAEDDPGVAAAIATWERQLAPLTAAIPEVTPPPELWPRIEASLSAIGQGAGPSSVVAMPALPAARDRGRFWKGMAGAGFLLAASIGGIALLGRSPPGVPVAVLAPAGAKRSAFVLVGYPGGSVAVMPIDPSPVPAGRDLELWSLAHGAKVPHPIGVLPAGGLRLAADRVPIGPAQILVSLEPRGGSPTGLPTGPVLYAASLSRPQ